MLALSNDRRVGRPERFVVSDCPVGWGRFHESIFVGPPHYLDKPVCEKAI